MWPRPGRALLALALAAHLPLLLFLQFPFLGWTVGALAVLACRADWDLRPAVPAALAAMAVCIVGSMAGQSLTVGTADGPVASVGGPESDVAPLETGLFAAVAAAGAVLLAWSTDVPARRLGQAALAVVAGVLLVDVVSLAGQDRLEFGNVVMHPGALLVLLVLPHLLLLAALAVEPVRGLAALLRGPAPAGGA